MGTISPVVNHREGGFLVTRACMATMTIYCFAFTHMLWINIQFWSWKKNFFQQRHFLFLMLSFLRILVCKRLYKIGNQSLWISGFSRDSICSFYICINNHVKLGQESNMCHLYLGWGDDGLEDFNFGGNFDVQRIGKVRRHMLLVHPLTHILFCCHVRSLTKFLSNYLIVLIGHCGICVESLRMSGYGVLRTQEQKKICFGCSSDMDLLGSDMSSFPES